MSGTDLDETPGYDRTPAQLPPGESPSTKGPAITSEMSEDERGGPEEFSDSWLIQKSTEIYTQSTDYLDSNITNHWERSLAHFNNEHAPGTYYHRKDFRRSRTFRPKTRANVKQQEAALANAAFSTLNLVEVQAIDERNEQQQLAAAIRKILLEHRLSYRMPWFLTVQGAYQNTKVYGLTISHQHWIYREEIEVEPAFDETGMPIMDPATGDAMGYERVNVIEDRLACDLVEPENFRFDPMCDWRRPAETSPYLIRIVPMYAGDALEMMKAAASKTNRQQWREYSLQELLATRSQDYNSTRQARQGRNRIDPADEQHGNEFSTIWAHMNIIRVDGVDWVYWTMGTELLLTDPVPLREEYPWLNHGERPFVVGYSTVEAFRNYPAGDVEQSAPLQSEINDIANQRQDNVKLVLNKRYYVRRGSQVDLDALIRNTPGGGVMMNDPDKDVVTVNTPDVTSSSYQEQGVLNQEFDELVGGFNPAAQQGNSVAGQQLGAATAGAVQDYGIKIFIETWLEPVLRQLDRLIAMYETDETVMRLAGEKTKAFERMGVDEIPDSLMMQNLYVKVDIGMGNTDPMRKVERLVFGVSQAAGLPGMATRVKGKPIADAIFGSLGYRDSSNFFMTDQEFEQYLKENPPGPSEIDVKMKELEIRDEDNAARDEREREKINREFEAKVQDILAKQDMKLDELMAMLGKAKMSDSTQRDIAAAKTAQDAMAANLNRGGGG